jgi:hypothetical protein
VLTAWSTAGIYPISSVKNDHPLDTANTFCYNIDLLSYCLQSSSGRSGEMKWCRAATGQAQHVQWWLPRR